MNLYWVVVYPLYTKFPFSNWSDAIRFYELVNIYHPNEVTMMYPE